MAQITRVPLGLQKALGLQTQGDNPSEFLQGITPGIDLSRYYDLRQTYWKNVGGAATVESIGAFVIPEGEIWIGLLASVAIRGTGTGAGDNAEFGIYANGLQQSDAPTQFHGIADLGSWEDTAGGGTARYQVRTDSLENVVLFGGTTVNFVVSPVLVTAGSINWRMGMQYLRLQI